MYKLLYYTQTNVFCIIILLIMFIYLNSRKINTYEIFIFKCILLSIMLFCVSDIVSIVFRESNFEFSSIILFISNTLYLFFPLLVGYFWNIYIHLNLSNSSFDKFKIRFLTNVPIIIGTILLVSNFFTKSIFIINSNNIYQREQFFFLYIIISWSYILFSTIFSIKNYIKADNIYLKEKIFPFCLFIVAPVAASLIQNLFYGLTTVQMGFTISILIVFLNFQEKQIAVDNLTKINNRKKFNEYFHDKFKNAKDDDILSLMFIDVDKFKNINDKYGHIVGDDALMTVSSILKETCLEYDKGLFLARYGGDEFVIVSSADKNDMKKLENLIHSNLEKYLVKNKKDYSLTLSIGIISNKKAHFQSTSDVIKSADKLMYKIKNKKNNE